MYNYLQRLKVRILTREEVLSKLLKSYSSYFNIEELENTELPLAAKCTLNVHSEKYVLIKKAKLWSVDNNEHLYIFSLPVLTEEMYKKCRDYAYEKGMALIHPGPNHMYTYITALFICDECEPDAKKLLTRCRIFKNFRFSFYGWMDYHTALLELNAEKVSTNSSGRDNAKFLKSIIHVKNKK